MIAYNKDWVEKSQESECDFFIVVCDTFSNEDYPIFCKDYQELEKKFVKIDPGNMQQVVGIFSTFLNCYIPNLTEAEYTSRLHEDYLLGEESRFFGNGFRSVDGVYCL